MLYNRTQCTTINKCLPFFFCKKEQDKTKKTHQTETTVKPVLSDHSKRPLKIGFQYRLLFNAGQKYCRMRQSEHSAILSTFIKLPISIKTFVLSISKWMLKTGFNVQSNLVGQCMCIKVLLSLHSIIWASTRENLSSVVCEQHRRRSACASPSLISPFVIHFLECTISKLATSEISIF